MDFNDLASRFEFKGRFIGAEPYGMGHINDTYALTFDNDGKNVRYILQRMNKRIFTNVPELMRNVKLVTDHIAEIVRERGGDVERDVLRIVAAKDGGAYYVDEDGEYWRAYILIEDTVGYAIAEDKEMFEDAGKAFGGFVRDLSTFPAEELYEVIPNFHNTRSRFNDFKKAVEFNYSGRLENVRDEVKFVLDRESYCDRVVSMLESGEIPLRVTHNDTKLNNVLMDVHTNKAVCVIDLDTIMPGSLLYDFGDAIRSGCNTGLEDEPDLDKVAFDMELFESFCKGYLGAIGCNITKKEKELLAFGAILMTYECGMRFLGDYLNGDTYFKVHYETHNVVRARTQFKLVSDMEKSLDTMNAIVDKYCAI